LCLGIKKIITLDKSSKIYIAGHTGLVGSAIYRCLINKRYHNFVLRTVEELDLTRQADVEAFFASEKPEYVIDAAAKVGGIMANDIYRGQFIYENLMIQNNIIHNAYVHGVKKLLFLGSSCIYPKDAPQPLKEEYLLTGDLEQTNEPYAIAKIAGIKMCESYYRQYGCNFISVMPTNLYGPNDNYNLETSHVLPAMIRKMHLARCLEINNWKAIREDLNRRPIDGVKGEEGESEILNVLSRYGINYELRKTNYELNSSISNFKSDRQVTVALWGTGNVYREFLHVDDMASACIYVMENVDAPVSEQVITFLNIGTGQDLTIRELAEMVKDIVGFKGEIRWDSSKPDGTFKKQLDVSRLKASGWKDAIGLKEGIGKVYEQYQM
jgi:GDP-L-fucose synthase